jgi:hypothetical protein
MFICFIHMVVKGLFRLKILQNKKDQTQPIFLYNGLFTYAVRILLSLWLK